MRRLEKRIFVTIGILLACILLHSWLPQWTMAVFMILAVINILLP